MIARDSNVWMNVAPMIFGATLESDVEMRGIKFEERNTASSLSDIS